MRNFLKDASVAIVGLVGFALVSSVFITTPARAQVGPNDAILQGVIGRPDRPASPSVVSVSGASARTDADLHAYATVRILCDVDAYVTSGDANVTASTSSVWKVVGGYPEIFNIGPTDKRVAFITDGGTGSCRVLVLR